MVVAIAILSMLLAALIAFSAAQKLTHRPQVVESYRRAGVPEAWLNWLAALLLAAATALIVGLWWEIAGLAAAAGLAAYFVAAIVFHLRARDPAHIVTPIILAGLAVAVTVLQLAALRSEGWRLVAVTVRRRVLRQGCCSAGVTALT